MMEYLSVMQVCATLAVCVIVYLALRRSRGMTGEVVFSIALRAARASAAGSRHRCRVAS